MKHFLGLAAAAFLVPAALVMSCANGTGSLGPGGGGAQGSTTVSSSTSGITSGMGGVPSGGTGGAPTGSANGGFGGFGGAGGSQSTASGFTGSVGSGFTGSTGSGGCDAFTCLEMCFTTGGIGMCQGSMCVCMSISIGSSGVGGSGGGGSGGPCNTDADCMCLQGFPLACGTCVAGMCECPSDPTTCLTGMDGGLPIPDAGPVADAAP